MNGVQLDKAATRRRLWRVVRLGLVAVALPWFGWFAYTRWTTPPARQRPRPAESLLGVERLRELEVAVGALPMYRPSAGTSWNQWRTWEALNQALHGTWDPDGRPELADVVTWVSSSRSSQALDRVVTLSHEVLQMGPERPRMDQAASTAWGPFAGGWGLQPTITALAVRARLRHAGEDDLPGAAADLRAALLLDVLRREVPSQFHYAWPSAVALAELIYLAQERELPPALAAELIGFLSQELPLSVRQTLAGAMQSAQDLQSFLDEHYTDDGRGNGWLVVSTLPVDPFFEYEVGPGNRSGFWNLLSPLFNDRRTVAAKLAGLGGQWDQLDALDYQGLRSIVERQAQLRERLNLLDGCAAQAVAASGSEAVTNALADLAWRRAAVVIVALSACKHDHGEYPVQLDQLVLDYLDELPRDLVTNAPFVYERRGPDAYDLRCKQEIPYELSVRRYMRSFVPGPADAYSIRRPGIRDGK